MGHVSGGKRAGTRRAARPPRRFRRDVSLLALGIAAAVVAWGYLVYAAVDFGGDARDGDTQSWAMLGLASIGAVACLFAGLMLIARLFRALGQPSAPPLPRPVDPVVRSSSHRHRG
jgi:cytosine/uracil/thiamine/allantoin permease